jgi:hypothetical protein
MAKKISISTLCKAGFKRELFCDSVVMRGDLFEVSIYCEALYQAANNKQTMLRLLDDITQEIGLVRDRLTLDYLLPRE